MYGYYLELLGYKNLPEYLKKYLNVPSLERLKDVGYFCGMDYASKDIYNFKEKISRFDHSLSVCLLTYKLTKDYNASLAGLFHDISTPCFSHVIDYMNSDYYNQESTEFYTGKVVQEDNVLTSLLKKDNISLNDVINFKKYTVLDNDRPKLCADRLDGIILSSISWTNKINESIIKNIIDDIDVFVNEDNEKEIGFNTRKTAEIVNELSDIFNKYCHSNEDNYMMELLAKIAKYLIDKNYITYDDLYIYNEKQLFELMPSLDDEYLNNLLNKFKTIKKEEITYCDIPEIKNRYINPLIKNKRLIMN